MELTVIFPIISIVIHIIQLCRIIKLDNDNKNLERLLTHKRIAETMRGIREREDFID